MCALYTILFHLYGLKLIWIVLGGENDHMDCEVSICISRKLLAVDALRLVKTPFHAQLAMLV